MTGELIGWVFRCKVCNEAHFIQEFGPSDDHIHFPYQKIACPNKNISKVYTCKDFITVRGKAEWVGASFEKGSLVHLD